MERKCVKIGSKTVGDGFPCFIIAEIGINHNGSVDLAKKMIDIAVTTGCDAVKFQKRTVDVVYSKEEPVKIDNDLKQNYKKAVTASISFVPSAAGIIIASEVVKDIIGY